MATGGDHGETGLFAFDPGRCDAMSEVLAQRWWRSGCGASWQSFWLDLPAYPGDRGGRIRYRFRALHSRRRR